VRLDISIGELGLILEALNRNNDINRSFLAEDEKNLIYMAEREELQKKLEKMSEVKK
jgi:hypothetical protein